MKRKIVILIFLLIFTFTSCVSNGIPEGLSETEIEQYKYLRNNVTDIDITDDSFVVLADFNEAVKDYNIFLVGEGHGIAKNFDIQFYLLKNFVEKHGVKYILYEGGFATGQLLNRYLQKGDTSILDDLFIGYENALAYTKEQYNYYVNIYEYNKTLPDDKKLIFVGVDVQHDVMTGVKYLWSIIPEQEAPQELYNINELKQTNTEDDITIEQMTKILETILEEIENTDIYNHYLGEEAFNFKFTCELILQTLEYYKTNAQDKIREDNMCNNFIALYEHYNNKDSKYYGNWGDAHAHLEKVHNIGGKTFAAFLNNEYEATKGKTLSTLCVYYKSQRALQVTYKAVDISGTYSVLVPASTSIILNSLAKSDFALFNMMSADSPFIRRQEDTEEITYKYGFQYLLLIKNSPAATKFK